MANKTVLTGLLVAGSVIGLLAIGGAAIWWALPMFSRGDSIAANFTPVAPSTQDGESAGPSPASTPDSVSLVGRDANESAMLAVAQQFIRHARRNESQQAVALIDQEAFQARLHSPTGSFEAMSSGIPTNKLLHNFGKYALDGAPRGGRRHWEVIGTSKFDGHPGVVVRYYVESQAPVDALLNQQLFNRMATMVSYDQLSQSAMNLLADDTQAATEHDRWNLESHAIRNVFPSRAGYMMLLFDCEAATPRLVDLVNVLGQAPLSQTAAHVFHADYHVFGGFGKRETNGTKPTTIAIYGVSERANTYAWDSGDAAAEERARQKHLEEVAVIEQKRPKRLEGLVDLWRKQSPTLEQEREQFRKDFPGDLGFELAIVLDKMAAPKPTFSAAEDASIVAATNALYQQWKDPFFLYVQGLCAFQNGRQAAAYDLFAQCASAGFTTTTAAMLKLQDAVERSDQADILAVIDEWNRAWARDGVTAEEDRLAMLAQRYDELKRLLNPPPTMSEALANGARASEETANGTRGPRRGRGSRSATQSNPSALEDPSGRAFSSTDFNHRPPFSRPGPDIHSPSPPQPGFPPGPHRGSMPDFASRHGSPPDQPDAQVTIKFTSPHGFDSHQATKTLAEKLGTGNYRFSQQNQTVIMTLTFAGPLQTVSQAIDFGKVDATDEATRTIEVTIH